MSPHEALVRRMRETAEELPDPRRPEAGPVAWRDELPPLDTYDAEPTAAETAEVDAPGTESAGTRTPVPVWIDLVDAVALNVPRAPTPLGIPPLDHVLSGGIDRDEALVIGGAPGAFKTSLVAYAVASLATPETALAFVAADEPSNRVSRKIGTRFGELWQELCSDYPLVLERLRQRLRQRGIFARITHPRASYTLEDALDAFDREAPRERRRIAILDHIHSVEARNDGADDTEKAAVERVVNTLIDEYVRGRGWSVVALSEVTKAALAAPTILESPMNAFAGTRKIVSRFDAALVLVPEGDRRVRCLVAKNRFGSRKPFTLEWDVERWTLAHIADADVAREQETRTEETRQAKAREAQQRVLEALERLEARRDAKSGSAVPATYSEIRAAAGVSKDRVRGVVDELKITGVIESWDPVAAGLVQAPPHTRPEWLRRRRDGA